MTRSEKTIHLLIFFQNAVGVPSHASEKVDTKSKQFLIKKWNLHSLVYILNKFDSLKVAVKR